MALYLTKELENEATIYVWHITETEEELLANTQVPDDELEELQFFKNEARRKERLATRALLNTIFDDERVYLGHHDNGRPYLQNMATEISISHTKDYVAIIVHKSEDQGIDIECLDRDFSAVEKKALSEDEIDDLSDRKRSLQLAIYWCAKEAIFKRMSISGVDFAEQIEIERFTPHEEGELEAVFTHKDGTEVDFELEYMIFDNHAMVWVINAD